MARSAACRSRADAEQRLRINRYIHPAEPVYHDQPPRPVCGGDAYTSAATTYGSTRYFATAPAVRAWFTGLIMSINSGAWGIAQRRERHDRPDCAMRVLGRLAHARHVTDVAGVLGGCVERRRGSWMRASSRRTRCV
jgi:hypothetical protein